MHIDKIEKLNFGRFKDFSPDGSLPSFSEKLNILFGWNGSGKTTISKAFQIIETGLKPKDGVFKFKTDTSQITEDTDLGGFAGQVRVFNCEYVEDTLRGSQTIPYIFFAGKEAVNFADDEQKLKEKRSELLKFTLPSEKDTVAQQTAKLLKTVTGINSYSKELIGRATYASYDKSDFESRIKDIDKKIVNGAIASASDLIRDDIEDLKKQLVDTERSVKVNREIATAARWIVEQSETIKEILAKCPIQIKSSRIEKFLGQQTHWIEDGIDLHFNSMNEETKCLFCNSEIQNKEELLKHFSKEVVAEINAIDENLKQIEALASSLSKIDSPVHTQKQHIDVLRTIFDSLTLQLREKRNNVTHPKEMMGFDVGQLDPMMVVTEFNTASVAHSIEVHFVAEQYDAYVAEAKKFDEASAVKKALEAEVAELDSKVRDLKQKVKNTHEPAQALNRLFRIVFPYRGIEITDADDGTGYALRRNGSECSFASLSEGERNFIAFAYYIYSLNDTQNKLSEDGIAIIDDPVSSLDKQSIFQIFSIIVNEIKEHPNRQYFILTHNLDLFGHLKEHYDKKLKTREYELFSITSRDTGSFIESIHPLLRDHRSDYYYVFSALNEFKESCDIKDAYLVINLLRRWLETFLEFKFSHTGDFRSLIECAYTEASRLTKDQGDNTFNKNPLELYRFLNHGSHGFSDPQSMDDSVLENAHLRIVEAFRLAEILDPLHYKKLKSNSSN